jgi:fumarate hydratase class I
MEQFGIRAVIGKGGMGPKTLKYCKKVGAVYMHAIGGAAQVLAERVVEVPAVHMMEEFGAPEAIWEFRVDKFPVVVTMDSHGKSLHEQVLKDSTGRFEKMLDRG